MPKVLGMLLYSHVFESFLSQFFMLKIPRLLQGSNQHNTYKIAAAVAGTHGYIYLQPYIGLPKPTLTNP